MVEEHYLVEIINSLSRRGCYYVALIL